MSSVVDKFVVGIVINNSTVDKFIKIKVMNNSTVDKFKLGTGQYVIVNKSRGNEMTLGSPIQGYRPGVIIPIQRYSPGVINELDSWGIY